MKRMTSVRTVWRGVVIALVFAVTGCRGDAADRGARPGDGGGLGMTQFDYLISDEHGRQELVRGTLILPWPIGEGTVARGRWEAKLVGQPTATGPAVDENKLGPQVGRGQLTAEREGESLRINLNPQMNDNNVTLIGEIAEDGDALQGRWEYSSFAGPTASGVFRARRAE